MRKAFKRIMMFLMLFVFVVSTLNFGGNMVFAADGSAVCGRGLTWSFDEYNGILTISGSGRMYDYEDSNYAGGQVPWNNIKDEIKMVLVEDGVTSIGRRAFCDCRNLENVILPEGIRNIGALAFRSTAIGSVRVPDSVTEIGASAFAYCYSLEDIELGTNLKTIGYNCFGNSRLKKIYYRGSVEQWIRVSGRNTSGFSGEVVYNFLSSSNNLNDKSHSDIKWYYEKESGNLIIYGSGKIDDYGYHELKNKALAPWKDYLDVIKKVVIKDGITYIGEYAFANCSNLDSVTLPGTLEKIGSYAFTGTNLKKVNIPNFTKLIGENAFYGCASLKEVNIGKNVQSIGYGCFANTDLEEVYYSGTIEQWNKISKSGNWDGGNHDGKISYNILEWSFDETTGILKVDGLGKMPDYVYSMSGSLTAPWGKINNNIKTVIIGNGLTSVGDYAFSHCKNLVAVQLPESIKKINDGTFDNCVNLTSINLPKNLQAIGYAAFRQTGLNSITFPDSVTAIDEYAFYGTSIQKLNIPSSVTTIGSNAFANCLSLKEVEIGTGVKSLGDFSFSNRNLKKVFYNGTKEQWNQIAKPTTWNDGVSKDFIINYKKNGVMTDYCNYDPDIINVIVDGNYINFDTKPQFVNGRTMVPMRRIFEELGASVQWDNATWTAIAKKGGTEIRFTIDDYTMYKNGSPNTLDVPAQLIDGRTLVPLRAVSEAFGCDVGWDGNENVVSIISDRQNYTMLYTQDGRSRCFAKAEADGKSGWDSEPSVMLYSCEKGQYFLQSQVEQQLKAGWSYTSGHNWRAATCTSPKTCTRCGATSGGKAAHSFNKKTGKCDYCSTNMSDGGGMISH